MWWRCWTSGLPWPKGQLYLAPSVEVMQVEVPNLASWCQVKPPFIITYGVRARILVTRLTAKASEDVGRLALHVLSIAPLGPIETLWRTAENHVGMENFKLPCSAFVEFRSLSSLHGQNCSYALCIDSPQELIGLAMRPNPRLNGHKALNLARFPRSHAASRKDLMISRSSPQGCHEVLKISLAL